MAPAGSARRVRSSVRIEREWAATCGGVIVAGIDEAGRGPLAGPVVAGCVVWDFERRRPPGICDSKTIVNEEERERLAAAVRRHALAWGIGVSHAAEIDVVNILEATRLASIRACEAAAEMLAERCDGKTIGALVTDALDIPALMLPQLPIIKGDRKCASIAGASLLAKTHRDRMMTLYHREFPEFGWDTNRGYPTDEHYAALRRHGPTTLHRMTFNGVGFFDSQPRRSPSFSHLSSLIERGNAAPGALESVRREIGRYREQLPPPDCEELMRLVTEREGRVAQL